MRRPTGTIYQVAGHSGYRGQITVCGKTYYKYFSGSKRECSRQCYEWQETILEKFHVDENGGISWAMFRDKWNDNAENGRQPLAKRTIAEYNTAFDRTEQYVKPIMLADITMRGLRLMTTQLEEKAIRANEDNYGVNKVITCIRAALRWAMDKGYMEDFPIENLSLLPTEKPKPHTNNIKEIELLLKYGGTRERVITLLGFDCGLRPEEIFNLRWEKLNLETRFGWISPNPDGWHPKRNKSRQFRITQRLLAELEELGIEQEGYVIKTDYGKKFTQQGYNVFWKKFVKRINAKSAFKITGTLKTLRKDYCTYRQGMGADTKAVSLSMGHADIKVTQQHYTDAQQEALRQAREQEERDNLLKLEQYEVPLKYDNKEQKE